MFKRFIIVALLLVSALSALDLEKEFSMFNNQQLEIIRKAYYLGEPFDVGYTMAAIAWQESCAGKYLINLADPSAGVFHNNIKSVLRRHGIQETNWQINLMAQQLIESFDLSAAEALAEIEYWRSVHGEKNWMLVWQSYNGGFAYKKPEGVPYKKSYRYALEIKEKVHFLMGRRDFVFKHTSVKFFGDGNGKY